MNKSKHHSNSYSLKLSRRIGWFSKFCLFFCQSSFLKLLVTSFVSLFHFHMAFLQTLCFFLDSFFFFAGSLIPLSHGFLAERNIILIWNLESETRLNERNMTISGNFMTLLYDATFDILIFNEARTI